VGSRKEYAKPKRDYEPGIWSGNTRRGRRGQRVWPRLKGETSELGPEAKTQRELGVRRSAPPDRNESRSGQGFANCLFGRIAAAARSIGIREWRDGRERGEEYWTSLL
jgi:hypothetical protein